MAYPILLSSDTVQASPVHLQEQKDEVLLKTNQLRKIAGPYKKGVQEVLKRSEAVKGEMLQEKRKDFQQALSRQFGRRLSRAGLSFDNLGGQQKRVNDINKIQVS